MDTYCLGLLSWFIILVSYEKDIRVVMLYELTDKIVKQSRQDTAIASTRSVEICFHVSATIIFLFIGEFRVVRKKTID